MFNITSAYFCKHSFCFCTIIIQQIKLYHVMNTPSTYFFFFFKEIVVHLVPFLPLIAVLKYYIWYVRVFFISICNSSAQNITCRPFVCLFVCPSVCLPVRPSVRLQKLHIVPSSLKAVGEIQPNFIQNFFIKENHL